MKSSRVFSTFFFLFSVFFISAQEIEGNLSINKKSNFTVDLQEPYVVNLFKDFKTNNYEIVFSFKGEYEKNVKNKMRKSRNTFSKKPDFSFFTFKTTVKHNGKTIGANNRKPMPYIPGDMFLPAEAFDFIPILSAYQQKGFAYANNSGQLPPGQYEVILEAVPIDVTGKISNARFNINVKPY